MPRIRSLRALALGLGVSIASLALFFPRTASAFERQWHVGAGAGYSALVNPTGTTLHGFGGGLHLTYGMSDTLNLLLNVDVSVHPATTDAEAKPVDGTILTGGALGVGYVFDVLQWVPWVGATAGFFYDASPSNSGGRLALSIPFGLDYQLSRSFAVGVSGQYGLLFLDPLGTSQRISAFLRAEYMWGY